MVGSSIGPSTAIILGAGSRGTTYGEYAAAFPQELDIMRWIIDEPCAKIRGFGDVSFYERENAPSGSGDRCLRCEVEEECPYSAKRMYLRDKECIYAIMPVMPENPAELVKESLHSLETTNYGRCAFKMENDQPEHLACAMEFRSGATATFNMDGFTSYHGRRTRLMGTKGDLVGDADTFTYTDYMTRESFTWDISVSDVKRYGNSGHGGGDYRPGNPEPVPIPGPGTSH